MHEGITRDQQELLHSWLGNTIVVRDHSWPLQDTTVLRLRTTHDGDFIVKASATSHHIRREIDAYHSGFTGLEDRVPVFYRAPATAGLLVTRFLPGEPVEGTAAEYDVGTYRQAGQLLQRLHRPVGTSTDYFSAMLLNTRSWLDRSEGLITQRQHSRFNNELGTLAPQPVELVTTHGDYQPRNWLQQGGQLRIIDFGRAAPRPWVHDITRLSHQQLLGNPELEAAFFEGLGKTVSPEEAGLWRLENLNQAIGTVVWAHQIGDAAFEEAGRGMVARVLRQ